MYGTCADGVVGSGANSQLQPVITRKTEGWGPETAPPFYFNRILACRLLLIIPRHGGEFEAQLCKFNPCC